MPDLMCLRVDNGQLQVRFVECKLGSGNLRAHQRRAHKLLKQLGFDVVIARETLT